MLDAHSLNLSGLTGKRLAEVLEALETIEKMTEDLGEDVTTKEISEAFVALYNEFFGKIAKILRGLPGPLTDRMAEDLAPVLCAFFEIFDKVNNSERVMGAYEAHLKTKASMKSMAFDAYLEAGFSRKESLALLLNDKENQGGLDDPLSRFKNLV